MSDSTAPRGRGRGRGRRVIGGVALTTTSNSPSPAPSNGTVEPTSRSRTTTASATPAPVDQDQDVAMQDAPEQPRPVQRSSSIRRVPSVGVASSRAPSIGRERQVGGLLGSQSQFKGASGSGSAPGGKPKFRPNVAAAAARKKEKEQQYSDDEDDVKMEDDAAWKKRGPRPARTRQELEMTASGPMAQGPGGAPRTWGARPATASGAAVMAASREGTLNAQLNQDEDASDLEGGDDSDGGAERRMKIRATDLNDIGLSDGASDDGEGRGVPPLVLPRDPKVLRTKIRRLQERKTERLKKEALKASSNGDQAQVKAEPRDDSMSIEGTPNATPGPSEARSVATFDSKESTFAGFDADEKEAKDLKDLEEEEKKEINLSEAFDLKDTNRLDLYMFQFPRKFPAFVPKQAAPPDELKDEEADGNSDSDKRKKKTKEKAIKAETDDAAGGGSQTATAAVRKPVPPDWGRSGTRVQKAARWSEEAGKIGKLRVHKSGKVTLKLHGDLKYEVLPAAQPSFLQEIAVLDHPMRVKKKEDETDGKGKSKGKAFKKKKSKKAKAGSSDDDDDSSDSSGSDSNESGSESDDDQPRWNKKDPPPESLVCIGQTSKKFIVVPEITDLLKKVAMQEDAEKKAERQAKGIKPKAGVKKEK
ncbi:DNA-directed RNA polymerase III subunit RPC4 [Sporobolomyces salmoneus]|uniref:DNA-directed RNA polymerase III subunit RPC4 n=1 Tax=Sporobolomyces salmoneus TaxID=183962 RepID=UPI003175F1E2